MVSSAATVTKVSGSVGRIPEISVAMPRVAPHAAAKPIVKPMAMVKTLWRKTIVRIACGSAPSAIRIPISCVRNYAT